jgi:hypothetical protein
MAKTSVASGPAKRRERCVKEFISAVRQAPLLLGSNRGAIGEGTRLSSEAMPTPSYQPLRMDIPATPSIISHPYLALQPDAVNAKACASSSARPPELQGAEERIDTRNRPPDKKEQQPISFGRRLFPFVFEV